MIFNLFRTPKAPPEPELIGYAWTWSQANSDLQVFGLRSDIGAEEEEKNIDRSVGREGQRLRDLKCTYEWREVDYPKRLFIKPKMKKHDKRRLIPDFVGDADYTLMSAAFVELVQQFDVGQTVYAPVEFLKSDRKTPFEGQFFLQHIGEYKKGFMPDLSQNWEPLPPSKVYEHVPVIGFVSGIEDHTVLNRSVLEGPDIWTDPLIGSKWFMSDRLKRAIEATNMRKWFDFTRCRIVAAD